MIRLLSYSVSTERLIPRKPAVRTPPDTRYELPDEELRSHTPAETGVRFDANVGAEDVAVA